jgi:hypothetical protein
MTAAARPVFQHQGPGTNCVIDGVQLGWKSCTAYSMAMGIDAATAGAKRPSGCKIRELIQPRDTDGGLALSQVAEVAQTSYGVRVTVRTGRNAISPAAAFQALGEGRGCVLLGNTGALPRALQAGGPVAANHAVWVNEVRAGNPASPAQALVYDPAADGRRVGIDQAPTWWPWDVLVAFGGALRVDPGQRAIGAGKIYAGFVPARAAAEVRPAGAAPSGGVVDGVTLRFGARPTTPFPDRVQADPPKGRRVNVRRRPDRLVPGDIVDLLPDGALFIAFQRMTKGAMPAGSRSTVWYGNRDGTEWIHDSGLRRIGGNE